MTVPRTELLRRVTFALLVAATFAAFFVTQRLKHQGAIVVTFHAERFFSPFSRTHPVENVSIRFKRTDRVTLQVVNSRGDDVTTLVRDRRVMAFRRLRTRWDGRTDAGQLAPDGTYRIRVRLRDQGRSVILPRGFVLHTAAPRPRITKITGPAGQAANGPAILPQHGPVRIAFDLDGGRAPSLTVYRTDVRPARLVTRLAVGAGATSATWDGSVHGRPVGPGTYLVAVQATDREGNVGSTPAILPPRPGLGEVVPGHAGITVRYLAIEPPTTVLSQQEPVVFGIDSRRATYRWDVKRVGGRSRRKSGSANRPLLRMRPPSGSSGVFVLSVRAGRHAAQVPFAIQAPGRRRVLVVLPMIAWLGRSGVDDDGDGLPNTLDGGDAVRVPRVFAGGLPSWFAGRLAPFLAYLDHRHLAYDVATDLELAERRGVGLAGHSGVVLAGDEPWLPVGLAAQLRVFVRGGGRLASLGQDSLLRRVTVGAGSLTQPTAAAMTDVFGGRLDPAATAPGPVTNYLDQVGLFTGGGGQFSGYSTYQATGSVGAASQLVASAVTADGRPVVTAVRYGRGLVIRVGLPELPGRAGRDANAAALVNRIWTLLGP